MNTTSITRQGGFSLIELLVVLLIIGLLAGLVLPNIFGQAEGAKVDAAKAQIQRLQMAIETYYLDNGSAPDNLRALVSKPSTAENWNGPYVNESLMTDPWQNEWEYRFPGDNASFDLISFGADKRPGGEGNNADITNY